MASVLITKYNFFYILGTNLAQFQFSFMSRYGKYIKIYFILIRFLFLFFIFIHYLNLKLRRFCKIFQFQFKSLNTNR